MDNFSENKNQSFFSNENFAIREKLKHNVRLMKEYLYECEIVYGENKIPMENITVEQLKNRINEKITPLKKFGADNW